MKRIVLALSIAPLIVLLAVSLAATLFFGTSQGGDLAFVLLIFGLPISYISAALIGVPVFLLFRRRGWLNLWQVALGGALASLPFLAMWFWGNMASLAYPSGLFIAFCAIGVGSLVAVTFMLLAGVRDETDPFKRDLHPGKPGNATYLNR